MTTPYLTCCHPGCSRRVAQFTGSYVKRATTCRKHRPEAGWVIQGEEAGRERAARRVEAFVNSIPTGRMSAVAEYAVTLRGADGLLYTYAVDADDEAEATVLARIELHKQDATPGVVVSVERVGGS